MAPTVSDASLQSALDASIGQMVVAVETLRACLARASPIARQLQMDGALARLLRCVREAEQIQAASREGHLTALPDDKASFTQWTLIKHLLAAELRLKPYGWTNCTGSISWMFFCSVACVVIVVVLLSSVA